MYELEILKHCIQKTEEDFPDMEVDIEIKDTEDKVFIIKCKQALTPISELRWDAKKFMESLMWKMLSDFKEVELDFDYCSAHQCKQNMSMSEIHSTITIKEQENGK